MTEAIKIEEPGEGRRPGQYRIAEVIKIDGAGGGSINYKPTYKFQMEMQVRITNKCTTTRIIRIIQMHTQSNTHTNQILIHIQILIRIQMQTQTRNFLV